MSKFSIPAEEYEVPVKKERFVAPETPKKAAPQPVLVKEGAEIKQGIADILQQAAAKDKTFINRTYYLKRDLVDKLDRVSKEHGISNSKLLNLILEQYLG